MDPSVLTGQMPVYDFPSACRKKGVVVVGNQESSCLISRLGVPLAETLVLGVVACCEGNDHKTCLDCSSQLQIKGQSTRPPAPPHPSHPPYPSPRPSLSSPPPFHRLEIAVVLQLRDPPVRTWVLIIGL